MGKPIFPNLKKSKAFLQNWRAASRPARQLLFSGFLAFEKGEIDLARIFTDLLPCFQNDPFMGSNQEKQHSWLVY